MVANRSLLSWTQKRGGTMRAGDKKKIQQIGRDCKTHSNVVPKREHEWKTKKHKILYFVVVAVPVPVVVAKWLFV